MITNQQKIFNIRQKFLSEKTKKVQQVRNRQKYLLKKELID